MRKYKNIKNSKNSKIRQKNLWKYLFYFYILFKFFKFIYQNKFLLKIEFLNIKRVPMYLFFYSYKREIKVIIFKIYKVMNWYKFWFQLLDL